MVGGVGEYGDLLRAWLEHQGVSANELGKRLGGQQRAVRKWFTSPRGPYMATQEKVARALGLTLAEFYAGPPTPLDADAVLEAQRESLRESGTREEDDGTARTHGGTRR